MDKARLVYNNKEYGLRKIGDDLYELKSPTIFRKTLNCSYTPSKSNFWVDNPVKPLDQRQDGYHKIESFCFVTTHNMKREAALLLKSLRKFHKQPIYIFCDKISKRFFSKEGLLDDDIFCQLKAEEDNIKQITDEYFVDHQSIVNDVHKPAQILLKMDVMEWALSEHKNTFFLDSDIIVTGSLQERFVKTVCLSPHYFPSGHKMNGFDCGFYNAGYVFCAAKGFPQLWRNLYLKDSKFFEQEGMNRIPDHTDIETFGIEHNVGFWRRNEIPYDIKSFHFHTSKGVDENRPQKLLELNMNIMKRGLKYLEANHHDIYSYYQKLTCHKKIFFIHYGKAGGVYVNRYLKKSLHDYQKYFSWHLYDNPYGVKDRDWTRDELFKIAREATDYSYATQHHINLDLETVKEFKRNGWFIFTFLRRPEELLCSLYCWSKDIEFSITGGFNDPTSLNETFEFATRYEQFGRLWKLPEYIDELDYVAEFNDENLNTFLMDNFNITYVPAPRANASSNKGFTHYREAGDITDEAAQKLLLDPEYERLLTYL